MKTRSKRTKRVNKEKLQTQSLIIYGGPLISRRFPGVLEFPASELDEATMRCHTVGAKERKERRRRRGGGARGEERVDRGWRDNARYTKKKNRVESRETGGPRKSQGA